MTSAGTCGPAMSWKDWSASTLLHAALLLGLLWGLSNATSSLPSVTPLEMNIAWEAPRKPEPTVPVPALVPRKTVVSHVQPAPAPVAQAAPTTPSPVVHVPVQAADMVVATPSPVATTVAPSVAPTASVLAAQQARWHNVLEAALLKNKQYPMSARRMRQEGVVTIEAHFSAQGELLQCLVANGSGFRALDEAAMQLVRQAAEAVRASHQPGRVAQLRIPIVYELKES